MTTQEFLRAKKLCGKATPEPWTPVGHLGIQHGKNMIAMVNLALRSEGDVNFISESRQLLPKALAEIERLKEEIENLKMEILEVQEKF